MEIITFQVIFEAININGITQGECIGKKKKSTGLVGEDPEKHCHLRNRGKETSEGNLQYTDTSFLFLPKSRQKQERIRYWRQRDFQK